MPKKNETTPGTLGHRIRQLREDLDLSGEAFAKLVNANRTTVSMVESGKQDLYVKQLETYARVLHTSVYYLVTGNHDENHVVAEDLDLTDYSINFLRKAKKDSHELLEKEGVFFLNEFRYIIDILTRNPKFTISLFQYLVDSHKNILVNEYDPELGKRVPHPISVKDIDNFLAEDMDRVYRLRLLDELKKIHDNFDDTRKVIHNQIEDIIEEFGSRPSSEEADEDESNLEFENDEVTHGDYFRILMGEAIENSGGESNGND